MVSSMRTPRLSLKELGISAPEVADQTNQSLFDSIPEKDAVYVDVKNALLDGYAGVILRGPPGTSKSWYAKEIASAIAGEGAMFVQFHPSYQYEDFVEGWVPNSSGGFELVPKVFLTACLAAEESPSQVHVLVVDEISRSDAARVFGEALTYLEMSKRGMRFSLASGTPAVVPANLIVIGTMNPWDRGVDDLDVALLRRFAQIDMSPNPALLEEFLSKAGLGKGVVDGVVKFFNAVQRLPNPMLHIGHAYFANVSSVESLARVWEFQLRHHFRAVCRLEPDEFKKLESMWRQMVLSTLQAGESASDIGLVPDAVVPDAVEAVGAAEKGE